MNAESLPHVGIPQVSAADQAANPSFRDPHISGITSTGLPRRNPEFNTFDQQPFAEPAASSAADTISAPAHAEVDTIETPSHSKHREDALALRSLLHALPRAQTPSEQPVGMQPHRYYGNVTPLSKPKHAATRPASRVDSTRPASGPGRHRAGVALGTLAQQRRASR